MSNIIKSRYALKTVNKNFYQTINVVNDINTIRKKKICAILGYKNGILPGVVFVPYILV